MNNLVELKREEMRVVNGGRKVRKIDLDGDGKWDVKLVYNNDGSLRRIVQKF